MESDFKMKNEIHKLVNKRKKDLSELQKIHKNISVNANLILIGYIEALKLEVEDLESLLTNQNTYSVGS